MYTVEVPMYSFPLPLLKELKDKGQLRVVLYGSLPNSPLNGGRPNFLLDGVDGAKTAVGPGVRTADATALLKLAVTTLTGFQPQKLDSATTQFYERVEEANAAQIPFWIAATNLFISEAELAPENMQMFDRLIASGEKHGVKNAVIVASETLEKRLRETYGAKLQYVSSCTKYYEKDRFLPPKLTLPRYLEDLKTYDYVVLTPQDSYHAKLMKTVCDVDADRIIAVADVTCDRSCNAWDHYDMLSRNNKVPLTQIGLKHTIAFSREYATLECPIALGTTRAPDMATRIPICRKAGIKHFKLGRSFSADMSNSINGLIAALAAPDATEEQETALEAV
jgi:hypothetical protein